MPKKEFLDLFAQFYEQFFDASASAVDSLAKIQKDFPEEYEKVREFSTDPTSIQDLIKKLESEERAVLLNILLQAGTFGKRMFNLFESDVKEKQKLSKDLREFSKWLLEQIKEMAEKE